MKKRTLTLIAVLAAISMLSFAVFAGNDTYAGYEALKDLLRNEQEVEVGSGYGTIQIIDNDEVILTVSGQFTGNHEAETGYGQLTIDSDVLNKTLEVYGQEDTMYLVDGNNVYTSTHEVSREFEKEAHDVETFDAKSEAILDLLMGDLKDDFTLEGENIVFELTKEEMPALFNLMTSGDMDAHDEMPTDEYINYPLFNELQALEDIMPELVETEVQYVRIVVKVENSSVLGMEMMIEFTGLDAQNQQHNVEVKLDFNKAVTPIEAKTFTVTDETVYELKDER